MPFSTCHARVTRSVAIALYPNAIALYQPDADVEAPIRAAYLREPKRLDDGRSHTVRLRYTTASVPQLTVFVDDATMPELTAAFDLGIAALDDDGRALVGFTASSTDDAGLQPP